VGEKRKKLKTPEIIDGAAIMHMLMGERIYWLMNIRFIGNYPRMRQNGGGNRENL
jgi:hypothetical protein